MSYTQTVSNFKDINSQVAASLVLLITALCIANKEINKNAAGEFLDIELAAFENVKSYDVFKKLWNDYIVGTKLLCN